MTLEPKSSEPNQPAVPKATYRVTHWPEYDRALVARGNLLLWFDEDFIRHHWQPEPTGQRGAPMKYSDQAIQTLLVLKATFKLAYRSLEGFARSLMTLMRLDYDVPDHTHLSRRAQPLQVEIPRRARNEPLPVVVDSTGLMIYGEGEWKVRKHGASKRRRWIKVHLATEAQVKDTIAVEVTTEAWADCEVLAGLIDQIDGAIEQIDGDGVDDTREAYAVSKQWDAKLVVPPRDNAVAWEDGHSRNEVLEQIESKGLATWKNASGYHQRSLAENAMYRLKQLFGDHLASRLFETQVVAVHARVAAMNIMTYLGMPVSVRVGSTIA
jgi:hypothetical protein